MILYVLCDPESDVPRYVGITGRTISHRLGQHLTDKEKNHKSRWIQKLGRIGKRPTIIPVVNELSLQEAVTLERFFIASLREFGFNLTNISSGGESGNFGVVASTETREKQRRAKLGKKLSRETREKMRLAQLGSDKNRLGKTHSPEAREKMRRAHASPKAWEARKRYWERVRGLSLLEVMWG